MNSNMWITAAPQFHCTTGNGTYRYYNLRCIHDIIINYSTTVYCTLQQIK